MVKKICRGCEKEFNTSKGAQIFCCRDCKNKSQIVDNKVICPICGKGFKSHDKKTIFCSRECYGVSRRKDKTKICPVCGISFQQRHYKQIYCSNKCSNKTKVHYMREHIIPGKESAPSKEFGKLLTQIGFDIECTEFCLGEYYFDFKIGNILLELNPYPYHNSTRAPRNAKPKRKYYHYYKNKCAVDNGYKCIMVWDWTTKEELIKMLENNFIYQGEPNLHRYNTKTKNHLLDYGCDKEKMIKDGYIEIYDSGTILFNKELQCN